MNFNKLSCIAVFAATMATASPALAQRHGGPGFDRGGPGFDRGGPAYGRGYERGVYGRPGYGYFDGGHYWHWYAGFGPGYAYGYGYPQAYYAPPPVYYAPPPYYYAPPVITIVP